MGKIPPFFEHAERVLRCRSIEEVWDLHLEKMKDYGFDRLIYGTTNLWTHGAWGDVSDMLFLSSYEQEVTDVIVRGGLNNRAAVVPREKYEPGAHSWRAFAEREKTGDLTEAEQELSTLRAKWGIVAGYTIWFDEFNQRSRSVIGLCARRGLSQDDVDALWNEKGHEIFLLNNLMHLKISQMPHAGQRNPLSPRQREVLQWVADGKTVNDIAKLMKLSSVTVEKHLRLARERLGVETTGQAVQKASLQKQLFVIEHANNRA
ncbi:helix-turn-helix transcriptional regulator [Marimonas lutisalis]|uniref:helix-turn-helix transcriptional regulator n=1 Tax=Marimonas lutisalis TaxID=2545756 RepID=UPI0010F70CA2|nr:LuxR family transcriptional regulator [Marimonas lutisalis]